MTAFTDHVLQWLQVVDGQTEAASVQSVTGLGTEWAGDTEGGFYDKFDVTIEWTNASGRRVFDLITGERMASLWQWVVQAWPAEKEG